MNRARQITGLTIAVGVLIALSFRTAVADRDDRPDRAQHLDKWITLRAIRQVEEHNDAMLDRIDDWAGAREGDMRRDHDHGDLFQHLQRFGDDLDAVKTQVRQQDEPWQTRDQIQGLLTEAADVGHFIDRSDLPREVKGEWRAEREQLDALARHYRLPPIPW